VEVTFPGPVTITVRATVVGGGGGGSALKVAVTCASALMEIAQGPVPEHAPCQPAKDEPEAGTAMSFTAVIAAKARSQSATHESARLEDCTSPFPAIRTASVY